ncbi:MAG: hypothetical protein ABSE46_18050 [Terracidiphilus sp.]|jgi:hypothetical protein
MSAVLQIPVVFEEEHLTAEESNLLTPDEKEECETFLRTVIQSGDCEHLMKGMLAGSFKRGVVSACMMGRARRFMLQAASRAADESFGRWKHEDWDVSEPDLEEMAYLAAEKACDIFPVSINFYDFACVLQDQGRHGKARVAFKEFLRRTHVMEIDPIARAALSRRDMAGAIEHARQSL